MFTFNLIITFIIIVAILLVGAILLQEPKERITPSGGSSASVARVGINQKADFLEKATWVLVTLLLFLTLLSSIFLKNSTPSIISPNLVKLQKEQPLNDSVIPINQKDTTDNESNSSLNPAEKTAQN